MKNILFVAGLEENYYFDAFIERCCNKEKNIRIYLFDPSFFPNEDSLSISVAKDGSVKGFIDVFECKKSFDKKKRRRLPIEDVDLAWYIRENRRIKRQHKASLCERFTENESDCAIKSFFSTLSCKWINSKEKIDKVTSNKFYQQITALRAGLKIPQTLISNYYKDVVSFSKVNNGLLLKSLGYIRLQDDNHFLYSQVFSHKEILDSKRKIDCCPVFAQKYISKKYEYRVMAIGKKVLSCRIDSQASELTKVDWRHYDMQNVMHENVDLPKEVQNKILRFMELIDLKYGAIDMIETPNGDFVFLEINPSGQWGWISTLANVPIVEAVVEMLKKE
ncbi:MAG: hypothetical protein WAV11_02950 [Minisyncoccia bacterium]